MLLEKPCAGRGLDPQDCPEPWGRHTDRAHPALPQDLASSPFTHWCLHPRLSRSLASISLLQSTPSRTHKALSQPLSSRSRSRVDSRRPRALLTTMHGTAGHLPPRIKPWPISSRPVHGPAGTSGQKEVAWYTSSERKRHTTQST